ncbi:molybdenum cofactor guanylyltransferase [Desulfohalovibrio reitneri]|uniref:molybdenum cofactor guanylyltransferase n=1 Tax=Desulfohalovibrio reitneri TaxID=1307759 RepID=UPI0004A75E5D|nr:NTP transferase domain-containing protein [Desulfohalovibrio reitneri]
MIPSPGVVGVVLAGGRSTRLGEDKTRVLYRGGCLLERAVETMRAVVDEVWISGRDPAPYGVAAPWVPDRESGRGPAAGVAAALARLQRPCLVISCDLPLLREDHLRRLLDRRAVRPPHALVTLYAQDWTEYVESLVAVYEPEGLPRLERSLAAGLGKLSAVFGPDVRHRLDYGPDEMEAFFNVNTPDDLAHLRRVEVNAG